MCECASFPFSFEDKMRHLIVLVSDHRLSFDFSFLLNLASKIFEKQFFRKFSASALSTKTYKLSLKALCCK